MSAHAPGQSAWSPALVGSGTAQGAGKLEALVGQLYPAIIIARIVSLEVEAKQRGSRCRSARAR
jgi:hypothetical protein